eukprot:CAMPEP_0178442450 /NCGR_PEP_ID=MMETSP0689_2-20121128/38171_1 /TAXON_ID=160604 /ORGANISM="Amphidinium massartii, Strain CS-259" /LENGTH=319 /DNA_ID=CAMNT_0020065997 /DNA_START=41 /DNA_END=996 /DNA_ORIENTATION=+
MLNTIAVIQMPQRWLCAVILIASLPVGVLSEEGLPGISARASYLNSEQLHSANAVMKNHLMMIEDQILAITTTITRLEKQLAEDQKLEEALTKADDKMQEGRQSIVDGLTDSQKKAHGDASEAFQKGIEKIEKGDTAETETTGGTPETVPENTDTAPTDTDVAPEQAETTTTTKANGVFLEIGSNSQGSSFAELGSSQGASWDSASDDIFEPLQAKSTHIETTLDLLQSQLTKVRASKKHEELELQKAETDMKMYNTMLQAIDKQLEKLQAGRRSAMMSMMGTMLDYAEAGQEAFKMKSSKSETGENLEREDDMPTTTR